MKLVEMELDHVSHPAHKLVYYEAVTTRGEMGNMITNCAACADEISSEHYGCEDCNFFLHKLCALHPSELTHSLHPLHPLRLLHKSPYGGDDESLYCDACDKMVKGFIYHCSICSFDLDFICTLNDGSKLNHISHPEHVLTYEKVLKPSENGVVCAGCLYEISGHSKEHYCCRPCNFFLHKLCAERPLKLTHSLHPLHSLQLHLKNPYANSDARCDACEKALKGFVYHCKICKFDLDLICAFPDGPKLNHFSHPEHVLTFEKVVKRSDKDVVCVVCLDEILGLPSEHYSCRPCNIFIHKLCAEAPRELTHSSHTLHPLQFIPKNPYTSEYVRCDICQLVLKGFLYYCEPCQFTVHLKCALPNLKPDYSSFSGGSKLNHFCHPHILTFEKVVRRKDKRLSCAACLYEISGLLADYYSCRNCSFFLHKLCAQRPLEFTHSLHPQHLLHLAPKEFTHLGSVPCGACQKPMKGFIYDCRQCKKKEFVIDFKCAFSALENRIQILEQVHDHPLAFIPRTTKFICDICSSAGDDEEDQSYACLTCDFLIHKSCALTTLTQNYKNHQHPLSLVHGVPEDLQIYEGFCCDLCHIVLSQEDLVSHCARCRYFIHVRCMIFDDTSNISTIKDPVDYDSLIKLILNGDEFLHWPAKDISLELIQPFLLGKDGKMVDVQQKVRHFSHEQHDMILFNELCINNDSFFKEEDEEILCDACIHPISAPYYCCQECKYYLHSSCANLPSKIHHFSHPHELKLTFQMRFDTFQCNRCYDYCNGFGYGCETCGFDLDLRCAALPAFIMHKTHDHPLFQMKAKDDGLCYACRERAYDDDQIFKCRFCDVFIHYDCAMHSRSIRHRWDRQHPLDLRYPPHGDHPDHFMCDMCEELIHPMHWLYSCFKCDVSFHCACAPRYQAFQNEKYLDQNIKYGGEVQISSHPHFLKYVNKPTLKTNCDKCEGVLDYDDVFECETCYHCMCYECVITEIEE